MTNHLTTKKILGYDDVAAFIAGDSHEPLVDVQHYDRSITTEYLKTDMLEITGHTVFVRDEVARRLAEVEKKLQQSGLHLKITYGYRHPDVQAKYFANRKKALAVEYAAMSDSELERYTHNFVAIPDIAGHPAGAAVDLTIVSDDGKDLDMGTKIADYSDAEKIRTFSGNLTTVQLENRMLLHDLMIKNGFAPFYGE